MKSVIFSASLLFAAPAIADVPIIIGGQGPYALELQVSVDGKIVCDEKFKIADRRTYSHTSKCLLSLAGSSNIQVSGTYTAADTSGTFDASFSVFDISPWTGVLRDETLDFGTRLERYHEIILDLDPEERQWFKISIEDLSADAIADVLGNDVVSTLPPELKTFFTYNVRIGDGPFIGPASQLRWSGLPPIWPNLTMRELEQGLPKDMLPPKGSELAAWYDRVLVVYELYGDGIAPIVFDPAAGTNGPNFFWLDEDTRDIMPFIYADGSPARALDILLIPFNMDYYDSSGPAWIEEAAKRSGFDLSDPNALVIDTKNTKAGLSISFDQDSRVPFSRTVMPNLTHSNTAWWVGR